MTVAAGRDAYLAAHTNATSGEHETPSLSTLDALAAGDRVLLGRARWAAEHGDTTARAALGQLRAATAGERT